MGNTSGENIKTSQKSILENLTLTQIFEACKQRGFGCAMYRLPSTNQGESVIHVIIDLSSGNNLDHLHLDEMGCGFIFHPFSSDQHQIKIIQKDIHIIEKSGAVKLVDATITIDEIAELFTPYTESIDISGLTDRSYPLQASTEKQKNNYENLISKTIEEINKGNFQKAVMARSKTIDLPNHFNPHDFFKTLTEQYNNAFVYLASLPEVGLWIGATPETLISIDDCGKFRTTALAATQAYKEEVDIADTTWSQKDIEEQAMVSRYIINCFKKIRLREFEEIGPRTHLSGNLVHLKTDYIVDMDQVAFPELGTVMLELLHPTSAVCGMPKEPSQKFIMENEGFDREYFSGFLGPVNIMGETNIFVNLRCMKISDLKAILYAGAGIISNSTPQKEWNETEIKMETLLKVLSNH